MRQWLRDRLKGRNREAKNQIFRSPDRHRAQQDRNLVSRAELAEVEGAGSAPSIPMAKLHRTERCQGRAGGVRERGRPSISIASRGSKAGNFSSTMAMATDHDHHHHVSDHDQPSHSMIITVPGGMKQLHDENGSLMCRAAIRTRAGARDLPPKFIAWAGKKPCRHAGARKDFCSRR